MKGESAFYYEENSFSSYRYGRRCSYCSSTHRSFENRLAIAQLSNDTLLFYDFRGLELLDTQDVQANSH